ncbi:hypothetical protein FHR90_000689 [Endobacter medicaginis]|uniref:Uncharacterized protein n=3 Tax=Endobacter medicaginis TaxID=1181271 RepID=A0A839UW32_9PROT|nr:hypothetical protein [Endobacter medicaginis]MBB3172875.1 hypothetical protein [Endobacter medicaginis]MCX5474800.1 hypothetical protein [Endobacter medicaginis]
MTASVAGTRESRRAAMPGLAGLIAGIGVSLAVMTGPARAGTPPGLTGPAAAAVMQALTNGTVMHCTNPDGHDVACQAKHNSLTPNLFYGDANGHGPNSDVLVITFYQGDPTGSAMDVAVAYFRRDGGRYRYVRTFHNVFMGDIAPGTRVVFRAGHVSFTGLTLRPQDDYHNPQGRTRYVLDLR